MSATIKVIYRDEDLSPSDHRDMFITIDDVIHLHYRELQLAFGRKEFEDFVRTFKKQADSLLGVIDKTKCKDVPASDYDGEEFKIWTNSQLKNPVAVNPRRISLEECSDGYRLHYRNCSLLLDEKGYASLKRSFATKEAEVPYASNIDELLEIFKQNRIKYRILEEEKARASGKSLFKIVMPDTSATKARAVMAGSGMEGRLMVGRVAYSKEGLTVELILEEDLIEQQEQAGAA